MMMHEDFLEGDIRIAVPLKKGENFFVYLENIGTVYCVFVLYNTLYLYAVLTLYCRYVDVYLF